MENQVNQQVGPEPNPDLDLLKGALIIFCTNLLVLVWFWLSPNLKPIQVSDQQSASESYEAKLSPFTEIVERDRPRPVRKAERLKPVLYFQPPPDSSTDSYTDSSGAGLMEAAQRTEPMRHISTDWVRAVSVPANSDHQ